VALNPGLRHLLQGAESILVVVEDRSNELDAVYVVWLANTKPLDIQIYIAGILWCGWAGGSSWGWGGGKECCVIPGCI
jgi:hypothetical protein